MSVFDIIFNIKCQKNFWNISDLIFRQKLLQSRWQALHCGDAGEERKHEHVDLPLHGLACRGG
jgi:hypothetical protein